MYFYPVFGVFSYMALTYANANNTEFTRIENGILDDLNVHLQLSVLLNSLASCSAYCSQSVGCKSYTWKNATSSCILLSMDIARNFVDPSIPQDIAVYTKYYRNCSEFEYDKISGISGYCFKYYAVRNLYSEAQNTCQNDGGHLVRISTSTKHGYIKAFMNLKSISGMYVDGTDLPDGTWRLSDGRSMFLNWRPGEPSGNEHCVMMYDDGTNNDIPCTSTMYFICEKQLNI